MPSNKKKNINQLSPFVFCTFIFREDMKNTRYVFINSKKYILFCSIVFSDSVFLSCFDLFYIIKREKVRSSVYFSPIHTASWKSLTLFGAWRTEGLKLQFCPKEFVI